MMLLRYGKIFNYVFKIFHIILPRFFPFAGGQCLLSQQNGHEDGGRHPFIRDYGHHIYRG